MMLMMLVWECFCVLFSGHGRKLVMNSHGQICSTFVGFEISLLVFFFVSLIIFSFCFTLLLVRSSFDVSMVQ